MSQLHLMWVKSHDSHDRDSANWYELREDDGTLIEEGSDHEILMALCDRTGVEIDYGPGTGAGRKRETP